MCLFLGGERIAAGTVRRMGEGGEVMHEDGTDYGSISGRCQIESPNLCLSCNSPYNQGAFVSARSLPLVLPMLPQNHDRLPPTPPAPIPAAMPHKEPRYPVYLPPPLSSSVPTSSRMARQSQSLAAQRRIQRAIVPSTPLRLASSSVASERTPLLAPPNIPRRQRTQQQPRPKVETARTRAISPEAAKQGESSIPQPRRGRSLDALPQPRPAPKPTVPKPFYRPRPLW